MGWDDGMIGGWRGNREILELKGKEETRERAVRKRKRGEKNERECKEKERKVAAKESNQLKKGWLCLFPL